MIGLGFESSQLQRTAGPVDSPNKLIFVPTTCYSFSFLLFRKNYESIVVFVKYSDISQYVWPRFVTETLLYL